jgi:hypothetical protein
VRSAALHGLSLSLARQPRLVAFSRSLVRRVPPRDRLGRIAAVFAFVSHAVDLRRFLAAPPGTVSSLGALTLIAGEDHGASLVLCALLQALGERARVERTRELAFVRVEVDLRDVARLPPHAGLIVTRGRPRYYLPLDARRARSPLGFLPREVREALSRRRGAAAATFTAA